MLNVQDWAKVRSRYADFWNHTLRGPAILYMYGPAPAAQPSPFPDPLPVTNLYDQWENTELLVRNFLYDCGRTRYYADGYPSRYVKRGPGCLAAMIGGSYELASDTIWFENGPVIEDYERDMDKIRLYPESEAYRRAFEMTRGFAEAGRDRFITSVTSIGGSLDIAVSLRGNETLLYDIYDEPEGIHELVDRIDELWFEVFQQLYDLLQAYQTGCDSWLGVYCEKRYHPLQCDFSAMLSPDQFDEFVMPSLRRCCDFLDYGAYHLDGPDCVRHVPSLLSIPNLDTIQWVPGAGAPDPEDPCWFDMYRQIQDAGKNLVILGLNPNAACTLLGELDQTKLLLNVACSDEREAEKVMQFAAAHA